jgi:hypothetical protein
MGGRTSMGENESRKHVSKVSIVLQIFGLFAVVVTLVDSYSNKGSVYSILSFLGGYSHSVYELVLVLAYVGVFILPAFLIYELYGWMMRQKPVVQDKVHWVSLLIIEVVSVFVLGEGIADYSTFLSAPAATKAGYFLDYFFGIFGSILGIVGLVVGSLDIVGGLRGRWFFAWGRIPSLVKKGARDYVKPSRTREVQEFLRLLYQYRDAWVNTWEPVVRLRSMQERHASDFGDLMSRLSAARVNIVVAGTRLPSELDSNVSVFLKHGGELSALLPMVVQVSQHNRVEPLDNDVISRVLDSGDTLVDLLNEVVIPQIEDAYPVRRSSTRV